jgi:putative transposase
VQHFRDVEDLRQALMAFKETYNHEWLIARLGYRSPAQARREFDLAAAA